MPVGTENLASLLDRVGEQVEDRLGVFPVDASVGDADAIFKARLSFSGNLLGAFGTR